VFAKRTRSEVKVRADEKEELMQQFAEVLLSPFVSSSWLSSNRTPQEAFRGAFDSGALTVERGQECAGGWQLRPCVRPWASGLKRETYRRTTLDSWPPGEHGFAGAPPRRVFVCVLQYAHTRLHRDR
jgi:hypothetical protein